MMKNETKTSTDESHIEKRIVIARNRVKAIDFIKDIYCIKCEYKEDCSARYPDYIYKCPYIVEWAIEKYKEHLQKE